jgi:hypothetical protein
MNPLGNYLIVRQSEAHAWAEVWVQGEGWVRVDPTAAVSPARVEVGIAAAVPRTDPLPSSVRGDVEWLRQARLTWDATANAWNQWVLGYTPDRQVRLLESAGVKAPSWRTIAVLLLAASSLVVGVLAALALLRLRAAPRDPVQVSWQRFCRKLARLGCVRRPGEGPLDFAARAAAALPATAEQIRAIARLYVDLRYAGGSANPRALRARVQAFRA